MSLLSTLSGAYQGATLNSRNTSTFVPTKTTTPTPRGSVGQSIDSYYCETCGKPKVVPSFYCPTCNGSSSARTSTPMLKNYDNCPLCNKGVPHAAADRAGAVYYHYSNSGVR